MMRNLQLTSIIFFHSIIWQCSFGAAPQKSVTTPPAPCGIATNPLDTNNDGVITVQLGQIPWQATVEAKDFFGTWHHSCGGIVVSNAAVLTAATCAGGFSGMNRVQAGIIKRPEGGFARRRKRSFDFPGKQKPGQSFVEKVVIHPNFDKKTLANNVAVLRLGMPFDFAKTEGNITYVCLPNSPVKKQQEKEDDEKEILFISGWGSGIPGTTGKKDLRKMLQARKAKLVDCPKGIKYNHNEFCVSQQPVVVSETYETVTETDDSIPTTIASPTTTLKPVKPPMRCEGDIGGPLFTVGHGGSVVLGLTSRGSNCTDEDPMIFIDLFPYLGFIHEATKPYY